MDGILFLANVPYVVKTEVFIDHILQLKGPLILL